MQSYFRRSSLSCFITHQIEISEYDLPLSKKEINKIEEQVKEFIKKYEDYNYEELNKQIEALETKIYNLHKKPYYARKFKDEYIDSLKERDKIISNCYKAELMSKILKDYNTCGEKTRELIAIGLVGLLNVEYEYMLMYKNNLYDDTDYEDKYKKILNKDDYVEQETFGWEDGVYLSTGDEWDYNPDREREYDEEDYYGYESPYIEDIELENEEFLDILHSLSKYSFGCYKDAYEVFLAIKDEVEIVMKRLRIGNKIKLYQESILRAYKALQEHVYKLELREYIRADISTCDFETIYLVGDVIDLYRDKFFDEDSYSLERAMDYYEMYQMTIPKDKEKEIPDLATRMLEAVRKLPSKDFNEFHDLYCNYLKELQKILSK